MTVDSPLCSRCGLAHEQPRSDVPHVVFLERCVEALKAAIADRDARMRELRLAFEEAQGVSRTPDVGERVVEVVASGLADRPVGVITALSGEFDPAAVRKAIQRLIDRHVLRVTLDWRLVLAESRHVDNPAKVG